MLIDEMLNASGNFGPAQWLMLALFSLVNILSAFHYFAQTFIFLGADTYCNNKTRLGSTYDFDTVIMEVEWFCDASWTAPLSQSMFFIGSVVGTLLIGYGSDRLGRRPMLVVANLLATLGNLLTANLSPSLTLLSTSRFIAGLAVDSNFFMMYILVMEYVPPSLRTVGLNLCIGVWYCVGCMATPWLAVVCGDWRTFLIALSLPMLIVPVCCFFVPESAQWCVSRGNVDEAVKCFQNVAAINRKKIPQDFLYKFKSTTQKEMLSAKSEGSLQGLFATPKLRKKYCILIFKTMVLTLCYDAISRNIERLDFDPFLMFTISSATIFPSCVVILLLQDKLGRKAIAVSALLLTGFLNLIQGVLLATNSSVVGVGLAIVICNRFAVNIAYNSGTQYAAELIPTQVRGQGLSTIHVVGYVAAFFSPQIIYLYEIWSALPDVILGFLSVAGAVCCMFLPETLGRTLPVTLEDGEAFGEDEKFWQFFSLSKRKSKGVTRMEAAE